MVILSNEASPYSVFQDEAVPVQDGVPWSPAHAFSAVTSTAHHLQENLRKVPYSGLRSHAFSPGDMMMSTAVCVQITLGEDGEMDNYSWRTVRAAK